MILTLPLFLHGLAEALLHSWHPVVRRSRRPAQPPSPSSVHDGGLRVDRIDDPAGTSRIVRIVGEMSPATLPLIFDAWNDVMSPHLVHIDVTDAVIADLPTMRAFAQAVDQLECRQIRIRIVGLDPSHPAIIS